MGGSTVKNKIFVCLMSDKLSRLLIASVYSRRHITSRNATVRGHVPKASFSCTRPAHAHNFCAKAPFSFLGTTAVYYIVNLRNFIRKITRSWALIRYPSHGSSPCRNMNIHSGKLQSVP